MRQIFRNLLAAVLRVVVRQQQFPIEPLWGQDRIYRANERFDVVRLVKHGNDYGAGAGAGLTIARFRETRAYHRKVPRN